MGITIHYRGTMDDVSQIETMEDRVLDLVFSLGGRATIWRSFADHDSSRVVRGLMIEMEPGQDTFSLLISPEGHLTPVFQIEDAEKAPFDEPPYCFVKTQFGSLQGHIAIVHMLDALRQQYCSNLKVSDEGEYHENRDINALNQKMQFLRTAINSMADGLREHGLSKEAAEDPNILATRIERIAALVHQKLTTNRQPTGRTSNPPEDNEWNERSLDDEVQVMDEMRRRNDLRSERMSRRIAEAAAGGLSASAAFELAMEEEGLPVPRDEVDHHEDPDYAIESEDSSFAGMPPTPFDESTEQLFGEGHPAVQQAQAFLLRVMDLANDDSNPSSFIAVLTRGSMDMVGGLVQATCGELDDITLRALAITQLKRALTGHAFARGAVFGLRSEEAITQEQSAQLHDNLKTLLTTIHALAEEAWQHDSKG